MSLIKPNPFSGVSLHHRKVKLNKKAPLTREGEVFLFKKIEKGGWEALKARDEIIALNQGIIKSVANLYRGISTLSIRDLIQEGNIGLLIAIDKFDYRRGYKFSTYAKWWLLNSMQKAIRNNGRTVRLPVKLHKLRQEFNRFLKDLEQAEGRSLTIQELIELTGLSAKEINRIMQNPSLLKPLLLDREIFKDDPRSPTYVERQLSSYPPQDELVDFKLILEKAQACLPYLSPNQRIVIQLRFGNDEMTLEEVGSRLGVSHQRVHQIEVKALKWLKMMVIGGEKMQAPKNASKTPTSEASKIKVYSLNHFNCAGRLPRKVKSALKATKLFRFPQVLLDKGKDFDLPVAIHYGASHGIKYNLFRVTANILSRDIEFVLLSTKSSKEIRKGPRCLIFNTLEIEQTHFPNFVTTVLSIQHVEMLSQNA